MHVVILGAGGLGCVIGACLAETGVDVSLVARPQHVDAIRRDGLQISGMRGDRSVPMHAVADPREVEGPIDYLILLTKTRDTEVALDSAATLRDHTAVALSLQNSVTKDDRLADWISSDRVLGATTVEAGTMTGPGQVRHTATAPTSFYFGELDGRESTRAQRLADAFTTAGMGARAITDIRQAEWEKLLQISVVAGFSASTLGFREGSAFAHGIATRSGAEHYVTIATELLAVYMAMGFEPRDFFAPFSQFRALADATFDEAVDNAYALGTTMVANGVIGRPSLHEDIVRGRPTEVEDGLGTYLRAADAHHVDVPTARGAYRVIKTLEALQ
ncbi:MAG TPA: ketopantoate reductase family protein [Acidimicrobiales bacterium]|nr:ketopantoate reductase family protein [Acidimicrobiales bacterium]